MMIKQKNELKRLEENADRIKNIIKSKKARSTRDQLKSLNPDSNAVSTALMTDNHAS